MHMYVYVIKGICHQKQKKTYLESMFGDRYKISDVY